MNENLEHKRHTLAHLLAAAVRELFPGSQNAIGPAIENGFYQDFEIVEKIGDENLPAIEKKMKELILDWKHFDRKEVTKEEALKEFSWNKYKSELIEDFAKEKKTITFYTCGGLLDLCKGGHSKNPSEEIAPDSFKLERVAGAYWKGDEKNKMLTRIYGLAFNTKEELDAYENQQEEAKKRDHRKIGRELKLFTISELIGAGLPLIMPKGMIVRKEIEDFLWELHKNKGYSRVWTPHITREELYEVSGHASKFGDELFRVQGKEDKFIMKPMNCPHHMQIFSDNQFSYRDMPVRYFEPATVYRDEKSGQLGGLTRVRAITQDDGHLFCRVSQIKDEAKTIVEVIKKFYEAMGMMEGYWVRLSLRGSDKSKYLGGDEVWNEAEKVLRNVCESEKLPFVPAEDEAAFYGPKLDFMFKDSIGREWQLATIQCDFNLPERFDLSFTNEKGEKERPVVIHRAISGSLERFMGVMIEHFAGAFPLWLSPVQVKILPISDKHIEYCEKISTLLKENNIRVELDDSNEGLGKKVRNAKIEKIPYMIVVGDKDIEKGVATLEGRSGKVGEFSKEKILELLLLEIKEKK